MGLATGVSSCPLHKDLPSNMFLVQFLPKLRTTTLTTTHFAAATAAPFPQFLRSLSTTATPTTTTTTSPPSPVHRSNSPLTVGRKTFRKRHQKRYKRRARQTQLNDKVVKQQKKDALARRDAKRIQRWREAAQYKAGLLFNNNNQNQ